MAEQTIIVGNSTVVTGRLVDHLGGGRAEIDCDGRRYVGRKADTRAGVDAPADLLEAPGARWAVRRGQR